MSFANTPADIDAAAALLGERIDALDRDVQAHAAEAVKAGLFVGWLHWALGARTFVADVRSSVLNRLGGAAMERVDDYESELADWRGKFAAVFPLASVAPPPPASSPGVLSGLFDEVKWPLLGLAGLAVWLTFRRDARS